MITSNLCDYGDAQIHAKATITVPNRAADAAPLNSTNKKVTIKNFAPFTNCISDIRNIQVDDAQDVDKEMPMYDLIEYSDIYLKTSGSLWQYYGDEKTLPMKQNVIEFSNNNNKSISFKFKETITEKIRNGGRKDAEIIIPLKYLSNFLRTLEIPLINCEISFQLKQSEKCVFVASTEANVKKYKYLFFV